MPTETAQLEVDLKHKIYKALNMLFKVLLGMRCTLIPLLTFCLVMLWEILPREASTSLRNLISLRLLAEMDTTAGLGTMALFSSGILSIELDLPTHPP